MKKWYSIQNLADSAEILIYDVIGKDFWGEGVGAEDFAKDLSNIKSNTINVRINSPGGSVMDGTAIYNSLKSHPAKINVIIDGWALSAASFIAMAGDHISMADNAMMMIHNPIGMSYGESKDHRKSADMQDKAKDLIIKTYQNKSDSLESDHVSKLMDEETWMTADEALANGFIDEVITGHAMAASYDSKMLKNYKHVPELLNNVEDITKPEEAAAIEPEIIDDDKNIENNGRSISLLKKEVQLLEID